MDLYFEDKQILEASHLNTIVRGITSLESTVRPGAGTNSLIQGNSASGNSATGMGSVALNTHNTSTAQCSAALGDFSNASGYASLTEGFYTAATNSNEHAEGRYNKSNKASATYGNAGNTQHSIGIGKSETTRKNAFEAMQNGDIYIYGLGGYDGTNAGATGVKTLQQLLTQ